MSKSNALLFTLLLSFAPVLGAATAVEEKILDCKGVRELAVDNVNGRIEVIGSARADILVRATKNAETDARLKSLAFSSALGPDGRLTIETKPTRAYLWGVIPLKVGGRIDYRIEIPQGMSVILSTVNGDILAAGPVGLLHAETVNGDIKAEVMAARAEVETVNGAIHLSLKDPAPKVQAEAINGVITLRLEENADTHFAFETVSGNIRFVPDRFKVKG